MRRLHAWLALIVIATVAACSSSGSGASGSLWTYGPTAGPAATSVPPTVSPTAVPSTVPSAGPATIALSEWKVDIASTIAKGSATFTISNAGTIPHELLVFKSDLEASAYPVDAAGDIVEDGAGVTLVSDGENIDPAGTQERTVDLVPGKYLFVCNIAGHFKAGMFTVVTVTP
jgi:uncharacterized cupredoxin-like copper-binding protein